MKTDSSKHRAPGRIKKIFLWTLFVFVVGGIGGFVGQRWVFPRISTWPVLRDFDLFLPQAPIVITKREEIRINEGINHFEVAQRIKNSLVVVYLHEGEFGSPKFKLTAATTGVVFSSDGLIIIPSANLRTGLALTAVLANKNYKASVLATDPVHGIAFLKIQAIDLTVAKQGFARDTQIGEKLIVASAAETSENAIIGSTSVSANSFPQSGITKLYTLAEPNAYLYLDILLTLENLGAVVVNKDAAVVGFVAQIDGNLAVVRSEDFELSAENYLSDKTIAWPGLKIGYQIFGEAQSKLFGYSQKNGILIKTAVNPLRENDFVFAVDGEDLAPADGFQDKIFEKKPGDKVKLKLIRAGAEMEIEITL